MIKKGINFIWVTKVSVQKETTRLVDHSNEIYVAIQSEERIDLETRIHFEGKLFRLAVRMDDDALLCPLKAQHLPSVHAWQDILIQHPIAAVTPFER